jgi:hypothetical protein
MNIQNQIIAFDSSFGSIVVKYFSDEYPEGMVYNIDLPIVDGAYPSEQEIQALIENMKPAGQMERLVAVRSATPPANLTTTPNEVIPDLSTTASGVRAIRDQMLASSDWSQLPDAPLSDLGRAAWVEYRQMLRDVPEQAGFPENVEWPLPPDSEPR